MTSTLSAERRIRDWEVSSTVGVALKHVPALDSNPTLRRKTPQSRAQVLFFKDFSGVPSRLSGRTFGKGVGGLGGSSGALEGGTSTVHPADPWQVLQCIILSCFGYLHCCCPLTLAAG